MAEETGVNTVLYTCLIIGAVFGGAVLIYIVCVFIPNAVRKAYSEDRHVDRYRRYLHNLHTDINSTRWRQEIWRQEYRRQEYRIFHIATTPDRAHIAAADNMLLSQVGTPQYKEFNEIASEHFPEIKEKLHSICELLNIEVKGVHDTSEHVYMLWIMRRLNVLAHRKT